MTERKQSKFVLPRLPAQIGGGFAFTSDLAAVMNGVERYSADVPDAVHDAAAALAIALSVLEAIESETPEPSADRAQDIRNLVAFNGRHADEIGLARRAYSDAATVLVSTCWDAVPFFEPQFAALFDSKAAAIAPLLGALERFRTERVNFVMGGYQASTYDQSAVLASSSGSADYRSANLLSADLDVLANVRQAIAYLLPGPTQLEHFEPELVTPSRLVRLTKDFDGRDLAAAMRAKGLERWAAITATRGATLSWQTVADQEALQLRLVIVPRAYGA
jgi:hypothetical protein